METYMHFCACLTKYLSWQKLFRTDLQGTKHISWIGHLGMNLMTFRCMWQTCYTMQMSVNMFSLGLDVKHGLDFWPHVFHDNGDCVAPGYLKVIRHCNDSKSWESNFNWYIKRQTAPVGQHHVTNDFRFNSSNTDCSLIYRSNK